MKIFLSSTYEDLAEYRNSVMDVLHGNEIVFKGMEYFGASEYPSIDVCLKNIAESDRIIVLLGTRYGSRLNGSIYSFTEIEIREAEKLSKPIQAYFLDTDNQSVLLRYVDEGKDKSDLNSLKDYLKSKYNTEKFTTPEDLGKKLARDLLRVERINNVNSKIKHRLVRQYRETAYDALANWYDEWYNDHWCSDEPYGTITSIIKAYHEESRGSIKHKRILDCACGTGNTYVSFTKNGFEIYGADGSRNMLLKAKENCENLGISTERLVLDPLNWTDGQSYREKFGSCSLDVIVNTANSFCHIPPVAGYMDVALNNFYDLLSPGGLLIIDTKKYIKSIPINGPKIFQELRYFADEQEWIVRSERSDPQKIESLGMLNFHTRLMYDNDPAFKDSVQRALIVVTIYGESINPQVHIIPYYPLPAAFLRQEMLNAGFKPVAIFPAMENLSKDWKYDLVVGRKPG
jgi:SAM-dependent methyltransferase